MVNTPNLSQGIYEVVFRGTSNSALKIQVEAKDKDHAILVAMRELWSIVAVEVTAVR
jgi:hypothetical protein